MIDARSLGDLMVAAADAVSEERSRADLAMERYADGDDRAFAILYDDLAPQLYRYALRETRNARVAEDLIQETLLRIHCARDRFLRGAAVLPWAYAIARRLVLDGHRRARYDARLVDAGLDDRDEGGMTPADEALDRRRREADLEHDLQALPAPHREAFCLVKLQGLSVVEAAQVIGITPGNAKVRVHRAAEALRQADARRQGKT